jgi:TolB protein
VAFVRDDDVHVIDVQTRLVTNVTNSTALEAFPSWSPGGKQIVFVRGTSGGPLTDILVMNSDGTEVTQLTADDNPKFNPRWSPDGKRIAFTWSTDRYEIWTMNADGTALNNPSDSHPFWNEFVSAWAR